MRRLVLLKPFFACGFAVAFAFVLLFASAWPAGAEVPPEPPPLAKHALGVAATYEHGAIATAEKRGGHWNFALAGEAFPAGHASVPPEKVIFEIGSISKVFTGLLLADAVVEGKLALTDTLAQRLPVKFEHPEIGALTLRQLATHTSCLPRLPDNMASANLADPYAAYDDKALFAYLATAKPGGTAPCAADYSNLAFGALGVVLERTYGKPWAALVREKITGPLGMPDTVQELTAEQQGRLAAPWDDKAPAHTWTFQAMAGAGALRSTTADMSRFADALLAGAAGPFAKAWPLLAGDYVEMPAIGGKVGLALEHITFDHKDGFGDSFGHEGGTGGYRSLVEAWPSTGRAVVVLVSNANAYPVAWIAVWRTSGAMVSFAGPKEIALSAAAQDDYVGVYTIDKQARFTILRRGDDLVARLSGQMFIPIFASAKDEFFYKLLDAQLSFHRDAAGRVDRLTLHQNGRDIPAARDSAPAPLLEFPSVAALADYVGVYDLGVAKPGAEITVGVGGDTLTAALTGQRILPVFCTGKDAFEYDVVPASLTFERNPTGRVIAVTLHQNGGDLRAPRIER
jgi:CubicO group peptidase (beta-lactamase class C family)